MTVDRPSALGQMLRTLGTQIAILLLGVIGGVFVTRLLGPDGRGQYALLMMIPTLAFTFGNLGFGSAGAYWLNRGQVPAPRLLGSMFFVALALSAISVGVLFLVRPGQLGVWQDVPSTAILLAVLTTPFIFLFNFSSRVLMGMGRIETMNLVRLSQALIRVALVVLFVLVLGQAVRGALIAFSLSLVAASALGMTAAVRALGFELVVDRRFLVDGLRYGLPTFLLLLGNWLNHHFDVILVKHYLDNTAVGLYTLAVAWLERLLYLPQAMGTTLFPRVAAAKGDGSRELVLRSGRHALSLVLIVGLTFALSAQFLFRMLYGEAFDASVPAMYALLPGVVMLAVFQVYSVALAADGHPGIGAWASGLAFPVNVVLNVLWLPRFGIVGSGLATTVSYSLMALVVVLAFRRRYGVSLREMLVLGPAEARNTLKRLRGGMGPNG